MGGIAALLQLATVLAMAIVMGVLGPKPATAQEVFALQQSSKLAFVLWISLSLPR
jgi:hypothetical protein